MSSFDTANTPRRPVLSAWCPTCQKTQPCSPQRGETERRGVAAYSCDTCQQATHEPVLRFMRASEDEASPAA